VTRTSTAAQGLVDQRLANQHLAAPTLAAPSDVVRSLGAVQAQDYAGAKWAVALRGVGIRESAVERAFAEGAILRTHVLRPTWHFVAPADIRWMLALTGPRVKALMASYDRKLGLDDAVYRRSNDALARALGGGRHLTRAELAEALRRARVDTTTTQRLAHLVMRAELEGLVCSGPRRGKQFTYALLDERVPPAAPRGRDEALLELTRRYFATRGPATAHDFAWWSGLTVADARRGVEAAGAELEQTVVDGVTYWTGAPPTVAQPTQRRSAHLLPNYDEFFIGFKDRSAIGRRLQSSELVTGGNALISYVVAVGGQLVGGWARAVTTQGVVVELNLLTRLTELEERAVAAAAAAYGAYLELPVELRGLRASA
jgi:hypothetical protein